MSAAGAGSDRLVMSASQSRRRLTTTTPTHLRFGKHVGYKMKRANLCGIFVL
jgi:hypothetical protein